MGKTEKGERPRQRGATRAGNYMAFVSDGAFNDLSTLRRVFGALSAVRIRARACIRSYRRAVVSPRTLRVGKKRRKKTHQADRIESNRIDPVEFAIRIRRPRCQRTDTEVETKRDR